MAEDDAESLRQFLSIPGDAARIKDDDRRHVLEQLAGKNWADLGVLEFNGYLLFPSQLWKRDKATGKFVADPCVIRVPRGTDLRKARSEAWRIFKEEGFDLERDKETFDDLEALAVLWVSLRDPVEPYSSIAMDPRDLEKRYDRPVLEHMNFVVRHFRRVLDPAVSGMSADELAALTAAVVARDSIVPLAAFDDATQASCFITLARLHQAFLTARSSPGPQAPSTAA